MKNQNCHPNEALENLLGASNEELSAAELISNDLLSCKPDHLQTDADNAADDLVRLVMTLIETIRQLMERQAIRKVEDGSLTDDEIEHLGLTLLRLQERMAELKTHFGIADEDLSLRLDALGNLKDILSEDTSATRR